MPRQAGASLGARGSGRDLTVDGLDAVDVVLREGVGAGVAEGVVRVHQGSGVRGVREPQGVAKFMGGDEEQIVT